MQKFQYFFQELWICMRLEYYTIECFFSSHNACVHVYRQTKIPPTQTGRQTDTGS